jgi:hypothetical protein
MKSNHILIATFLSGALFFAACGDEKKESATTATTGESTPTTESTPTSNPKGIGSHQNVQLTHPLDEAMVTQVKNLAEVICTSCHKTTAE